MSTQSAKLLLLLSVFIVTCGSIQAQSVLTQAPVNHAKWDYNLKRTINNDYQLVFHLELDKGWHVRAHNNDYDTFLPAPTFMFTRNDELELKGGIKPKGILEPLQIDSTKMVEVYSYKVLYIQELAAKAGTKVTGKYTYQICSDRTKTCQPQKTEKFGFIMK